MKRSMGGYSKLLFCSSSLLSIFLLSCTATDTLTISQSIRDGETLVSAGGSFEMGYFNPDNSTNHYFGIWYKKISPGTVVWVANRETPVANSSGVFQVTNQGIQVLLNGSETIIWSSNSSRTAINPILQLLESGNLVMRDGNDENPENFLWQSFDYPSQVLLPGMKLGSNRITGLERHLSSWKSTDDASQGDYTSLIDPHGFPQLVVMKGSVMTFRAGPWNGLRFSGTPNLETNTIFTFDFVFNQSEMYFSYELVSSSVVTRLVLTENGILERSVWVDRTRNWSLLRTAQTDNCDNYALCGAYGSCNIDNSPFCGCLKGFVPKFQKEWDVADWTNGCVRRTPLDNLDCQSGDGFIQYSGVKLPDTRNSSFNKSMSLEECELVCLKTCTCMAYTNLDISTPRGSGCLLWFDDLIDIREFTENGQDIYIRMASSEVASQLGRVGFNAKIRVGIIVGSILVAGMVFLGLGLVLYFWKKKKQLSRQGQTEHNSERGNATEDQRVDLELPLFDLATVVNATDNFSNNNKLGEGGFGPVYKGVLEGGQEIAVKRLSTNSIQGLDEFMNEVLFIAKLQHRNLVKLLGCCIQEEKMLIYEYMPNKSLDFFIFDQTQSMLLDWNKRFHIINGISRGLLYLHQDSRLRIIHRDLKAGNILLDYDMNPKISDFGMARSFGGNETAASTNRVVGTYGYMSPEYAIDGIFSVKSDVYSFGVLVLEIVSGKKNRGFYHPDHHLNLLGHAWRLYQNDRSLDLIDASVGDVSNLSEVLRSIHVGLLCVQRNPEDRPSMSSVVLMLGSESALPEPKEPGFYTERNPLEANASSSKQESFSANEATFTLITAR